MDRIATALASTQLDFAKYAWDKAPTGDYGVISMESGSDFICDNLHCEKGLNCYVDYFTRDASSTPKNTIESALSGFAYVLESVQFESDTHYIHYSWAVRLYG